MLVLTRSEGQSIVIGDDIVITVLRLQSGVVRIGVEAPAEITISRADQDELNKCGRICSRI